MKYQAIQELLATNPSNWIQATESRYFHSENVYLVMNLISKEEISWDQYDQLSESMRVLRSKLSDIFLQITPFEELNFEFEFDGQLLATMKAYAFTIQDGKKITVPISISPKRDSNYSGNEFSQIILNKLNDMSFAEEHLIEIGVLKPVAIS